MIRLLALLLSVSIVVAQPPAEHRRALPWIAKDAPALRLFDGTSTFGWTTEGNVFAYKGELVLSGDRQSGVAMYPAVLPATGYVNLTIRGDVTLAILNESGKIVADFNFQGLTGELAFHLGKLEDKPVLILTQTKPVDKITPQSLPSPMKVMGFALRTKTQATISRAMYLPAEGTSLFNGKDLTGWQTYKGDAKKEASVWTVTPAGELSVTNGPGDLQTTKDYADVLVRLDVKTQGKALNSGLFFRSLPNEYQQGYEMQIQNAFLNDDRTKPADFGTGAIYRRVPARKVVSNDNEWFTMHLVAVGPNIRTWVNGEPVVAWTDDRKADDNPRKGLRTAAGRLSLQGHDATTNILFKNITVVDLSK